MARVTASGPPETPVTRRAARALREEADGRARGTLPDDARAFSPFVLPDDLVGPDIAPTFLARPGGLPAEFGFADVHQPARRQPATDLGSDPASAGSGGRNRADPAPARRSDRADRGSEIDQGVFVPRHAGRRRLTRAGVIAAIAVAGVLLAGSTAAVTALISGAQPAAVAATSPVLEPPPSVDRLPVPRVEQKPVSNDICAKPDVIAALEAHDDAGAIQAAGGGEAFRTAVAAGAASCVDLHDPTRLWVVINKHRQYVPIDYWPAGLMFPDGVRSLEGGSLRSDASAAMTAMVTAAREAGVGEIALLSAFRSYPSQENTYDRHVAARGQEGADQVSARPGYSEHQSGLAGDVVPCAGSCGSLDDLAGSPQGDWVAAHSWEYGWIVRYADGATDVTGYLPEPWHLRYIGPELARAYHDGAWTSLEEFFGLEAAPNYVE